MIRQEAKTEKPSTNRVPALAACFLAVMALLLVMGCGETKKAQAVSQPPAPVTVGKAEVRTVPVTVAEASLGAKVDVPTIDGRAQLKIPPGTQSGQKLRLREKGVPSATKEGHRGDEIVEVKIVVPHVQDEKSKEILRELAKLNAEDPRTELWKQI